MVRNDDKAGHALAWAVLVINQFFSPSKHLLLISDNDYQEVKSKNTQLKDLQSH